MAELAELLAGYNALVQQFQAASLPAVAEHVVLVTAGVTNGCVCCVAEHSTSGRTRQSGRRDGGHAAG